MSEDKDTNVEENEFVQNEEQTSTDEQQDNNYESPKELTAEEKLAELNDLAQQEGAKFFAGNKSAGTRLRKVLLDIKNLSHEIKTPIFAIQGYLELLDDGAMDDPITGKRFVNKAQSNVQRLVQLLNDVDSITNLEINKDPILKQSFIIQDLISEAVNNLNVKWIQKNIQFSFKKGSETPIYVFADKNKVYQVIVNILSNATKYGKVDGQIIASVYAIEGQKILVEISDDGIGVAEEHIPRLFERFYRTDDARSREIGGTGLGLAICKHIIEAHNETMHLRSKLGVGTTVGFTLANKAS